MSVRAGSTVCSLSSGELLFINAGEGIIYEENITPDTGLIHGVSILLNTIETLKAQPYNMIKLTNRIDNNLTLYRCKTKFGKFSLNLIIFTEGD
ncbi:hypothetical protein [Enterobacter sp. ABFQC]|uniref:hypothetical protein n=1 Tax=Enterobacter sp. ABFQC TaxID=1778656 RepID=UPI00136C5BA1|nr:hypothetical protein [Enterobacter sp. ABFQC]